ncbi:MAG: PucR family transcriptional regulator, partial [Litoreibacter sp.]|nr:PucR family transcriptional regulator [Litoreibacter sp.]
MTQIITRYFEDAAKATEAKSELIKIYRFAPRIIDVFDGADGLAGKLSENHVAEATAKAYAERMAKGGAVMLVRAAARPLMAAKKTRDVTAEFGAPAIDGLDEEIYVKDPIELGRSILTTHPLLMTSH